MGFFTKIINAIKKASIPSYIFENNQLKFTLNNDETVVYDLGTYDMKTRHDPYVFEAYTLKNSDIYVEYIKRDQNTSWNGYARGFYETLLKEQLKLKSFELLQKDEYKNYEFTTYKVDDSFIIHMIYIWETHKDIFIIDTKAELFNAILKKLNPNYEYLYENELKGSINFDISLVKGNAFNSYFNQSN